MAAYDNMSNLNRLARSIHNANKLKGFDVTTASIGQTLMLVVSELAEALEADRNGKERGMLSVFERDLDCARLKTSDFEGDNENCAWLKNRFETTIKDTFEDEIADTFIRLLDLCGGLGIDIEKHIELKLRYNATRSFKHGNKKY